MFQPKKLLVLLLALLMVLTAFTACNNDNGKEDESTTPETDSGTSTDDKSTTDSGSDTSDETDEIPSAIAGVKFNDEVLKVLSWKASNITEYEEEITESSSVVEQAVFNRCDYTESLLNIKTTWNLIAGASSNPEFIDTADRQNSNGGENDVIVSVSSFAHSLTTRGVLSNLRKYEYFGGFAHPAWPESLINDVTVGNKLYFATGDISTNLIFMTSVVFFNKDLVKDLDINRKVQEYWGAADLYELVTSGKWTLDKLIKLCEETYHDNNNDGIKNKGDRFGLTTYRTLIDNFYYGGGYTTISVDGDSFSVNPAFLDAEIVGGILEQVNAFLHESKDGFYQTGNNPHSDVATEFAAGNVLFSLAPASHAYNRHSNTEDLSYSVLPVPKHSESQERYTCTQSFPYSMYCIASQAKNAKIASAFLEGLAEESYETTRPALFDKMMKGRYAEDPEDAEMWEYAVDANVFDVGRVFCEAFGKDRSEQLTVTLFRDRVSEDNENWSAVLSSYAMPLATYAAGLAGEIMELPD